jgi:hypothetical protein
MWTAEKDFNIYMGQWLEAQSLLLQVQHNLASWAENNENI